MEKYELVKDIGSGNFGVARLMRNKETKELVAMKYIDRGLKVPSLHFLPSFFSPQIIQLLHENLPLHSKYHVFYCSNRIVAVRLYCCLLIYIYIYFILWLQIDENVAREIINHRSLRHPNIIRFKEVIDLCLIIKDDVWSVSVILKSKLWNCRWFWLLHISLLLWSMRQVENSLSEFAMQEGSAKMRFDHSSWLTAKMRFAMWMESICVIGLT